MFQASRFSLGCSVIAMTTLAFMVAAKPAAAQAKSAGAKAPLEEITVTARKREESVTELPIAITVFGEGLINDANIQSQRDLFELTPGIHYDQVLDRNSAAPSVRGVQSNEVATDRTKVTQFIDGMPVLGSQGNIQFESIKQVEVYRGPQSAAFGRSTFGGAINYVTRDPGDEFEGRAHAEFDDYGKQRIGGAVSGPLGSKVGYLVDAEWEDSNAPSEFKATDGTQYGALSSKAISAKLVFKPTDKLEAKLKFSHVESADGPSTSYFISQAARDACFDGTLYNNMGVGVYASGKLDCNWAQGGPIQAQNDRRAVLVQQGETNDDVLFIAEAQSLPKSNVGAFDNRNRTSLQLNYDFDSAGQLHFSAFKGKENYIRSNDNSHTDDIGILIVPGMGVPYQFVTMGPGVAVGEIMSDPTDIDESYAEIRWVSPSDKRLRYVVGASYYDYNFLTNLYFGGYGAILQGQAAIDRYIALTGDDISVPQQVFSETATNSAVFFNATYDATERLALTIEGRYQSDNVGGTDTQSGNSASIDTKAFLPRVSFTYNLNDTTNFYGQIAKGNNPGGVNVGFFNPDIAANLDSTGQNYVSYDSDTFKYYREETLINYELGFKGTAFDNKLNYATAIFYMNWKDQAQSVNLNWDDPAAPPGPPAPFTGNRTVVNGGDLNLSGIEFEGTYGFTDNFNVRVTGSYLRARYGNYCDVTLLGSGLDIDPSQVRTSTADRPYSCYDVSGNKAAMQPAFSGSISPSYQRPFGTTGMDWTARADIRYLGSDFLDSANSAETEPVTLINLTFGVASEKWDAALYVNNLTDNDTPTAYGISFGSATDYAITTDTLGLGPNYQSNYQITPRQQRTFGIRANVRF